MTAYRKLSIKMKMFLMIMFMMAFIIILAFGSLYYTYSVYDKQLFDKSSRLLNLSSSTVDVELQKLEALSLNMISDTQIQRALKSLLDDDSAYSSFIERKKITDRLWEHISGAARYVQSVHLIDSRGRVNKYGETLTVSQEKYDRMIAAAEQANGAVRWLYPDDDDPMLVMVRQVRAYEPMTLEPVGILFLRINIERLVEEYAGIDSQDSDIILKAGSEVVYPYRQLPEAVSAGLNPLSGSGGYEIKNLDGREIFLSQKKSSYTGWVYYNMASYDEIFERIIWLKNILIVVYLIAILVVLALGMVFARSLTRPIRQLISQMKEVQYGDLENIDANLSIPTHQHMDELGLLQRTYRLMITHINTLIKENYASQLVIKETEFKALQAQINPHFLYNALDSIHWLAKKNRQEQISSMVLSLGYLLRSSISFKQNIIPIASRTLTDRAVELVQASSKGHDSSPFRPHMLFYELLDILRDHVAHSAHEDHSWLDAVLRHIHQMYTHPLTREQLARDANVSPEHFSREFKKHTGLTFVEYVTRLRIRMAQEHLLFANPTLQEIAQLTGYRDTFYLSRKFKQIVGSAPTHYRKMPKKIVSLTYNHTASLLALGHTPHMGAVASWMEEKLGEHGHEPFEQHSEYELVKHTDLIANADPDVIVGYAPHPASDELRLIAPTILMPFEELDWQEQLLHLGRITGLESNAQTLLDQYHQLEQEANHTLDQWMEGSRGSAVCMFMIGEDGAYIYGHGWGRASHVLYQSLGFTPPSRMEQDGQLLTGYVHVPLSEIHLYAADHMFVAFPEEPTEREMLDNLLNQESWGTLSAIREGRVYEIDADMFYGFDPLSVMEQLQHIMRHLTS